MEQKVNNPIQKGMLFLKQNISSKAEAFELLARQAKSLDLVNDEKLFMKALYEREEEEPTSIGFNIAIPHGKTEAVNKPFIAFVQLKDEFFWNEDDAEKIKLIFMIGVPKENKGNIHLKFISQLSKRLLDDTFIDQLIKAENEDEVYEILSSVNI